MKKGFWILVVLLIASIAVNVWLWHKQPEVKTEVTHDTLWRDTAMTPPPPTEQKETGETIYVKVPTKPTPTESDTAGMVTIIPPTGQDSATIALPVEQKRYDDSLYTAWVSGFRPRLDSILLHFPEITHTITNTVYEEPPRLTWGIQVGAGYGIVNRKPDVYIGIGATLRIGKNKNKRKR